MGKGAKDKVGTSFFNAQGFGRQSGRRKLQLAADFSRWLKRNRVAANQVRAKHVGKNKRVLLITTALRSLLRFLRFRGEIKLDLAACVPAVASWSLSAIPRSLPPSQVEQVLTEARKRSTAVGRRDHAILLLLARLGLRSGEVCNLTLEDSDEENSRIDVRGKGDRVAQLPMPADVGEAIAAYLKEGRPRLPGNRRLFIRTRAPLAGIKGQGSVGSVVKQAHGGALGGTVVKATNFSALLERFFLQRLIGQRQVSPHTISSYRDTFRLLLQFAKQRPHKSPSGLTLEEVDAITQRTRNPLMPRRSNGFWPFRGNDAQRRWSISLTGLKPRRFWQLQTSGPGMVGGITCFYW